MDYSIDLKEIADKIDFDLEDIKILIEIFLSSADDSLDKLEKAIDANDMESIFHAAHALKGSAANLTLEEISNLAEEVESSAHRKENIDYTEKFETLQQLIKNIRA